MSLVEVEWLKKQCWSRKEDSGFVYPVLCVERGEPGHTLCCSSGPDAPFKRVGNWAQHGFPAETLLSTVWVLWAHTAGELPPARCTERRGVRQLIPLNPGLKTMLQWKVQRSDSEELKENMRIWITNPPSSLFPIHQPCTLLKGAVLWIPWRMFANMPSPPFLFIASLLPVMKKCPHCGQTFCCLI